MNLVVGVLLEFDSAGALPGNETVEVIAVRSIAPEILLIEQALDATAKTDLIGVSLSTNGPAHVLVPAAAQDRDGRSGKASGHNSERPQPTGSFALLGHGTRSSALSICLGEGRFQCLGVEGLGSQVSGPFARRGLVLF